MPGQVGKFSMFDLNAICGAIRMDDPHSMQFEDFSPSIN